MMKPMNDEKYGKYDAATHNGSDDAHGRYLLNDVSSKIKRGCYQ